jgi:hypothetical protein
MKKKFFVLSLALTAMLFITLHAQVIKTANVTTAGTLSTVAASYLSTVTNLTITGTIDARDFKTMRDNMPVLSILNMTAVSINAYSGTDGTYPSSLTYPANSIPCSAFSFYTNSPNGKSSLTSVTFPSLIKSIDDYAFRGCTGLTSITIPNSIKNIGIYAFTNCASLVTLNFNAKECTSNYRYNSDPSLGYNISTTNNSPFKNNSSLTTINIGDSVKILPICLFSDCTRIKEINVKAATPPSIDSYTFNGVSRNIPVYPPLASREDYIFDPYWSEFFRIYAKDYVNNKIYLNKQMVSIMTVGNGYVLKQPVKSGESVSFLIQPDTNYKIASLTVNGANMLDSLDSNGYLNLKSLKENKTIVITPTNTISEAIISKANDNTIRSWSADGNLFVESNSEMMQVDLLDLNGRLIKSNQNNAFAYVLSQPSKAVNVIRVRLLNGELKTVKVISN